MYHFAEKQGTTLKELLSAKELEKLKEGKDCEYICPPKEYIDEYKKF